MGLMTFYFQHSVIALILLDIYGLISKQLHSRRNYFRMHNYILPSRDPAEEACLKEPNTNN